jgi:phosphate transport system permease protein
MPTFRLRPAARTSNLAARVVITGGGLLLVATVLAILLFIAREAAPLFGRPRAHAQGIIRAAGPAALAAGVDPSGALGFEVRGRETVFFRHADGAVLERVPHSFGAEVEAACADFDARKNTLVLGSTDGRVALAEVDFEILWEKEHRTTRPRFRWRGAAVLDTLSRPVVQAAADRDGDGSVALAALLAGGRAVYVLLDASGAVRARHDLGDSIPERDPQSLAMSLAAGVAAVGTRGGTLYVWTLDEPERPALEDHVRAAADGITALRFLLGDQTLVVGTERGEVSTWMRVRYVRVENRGARPVDMDGEPLAPGNERTVLDRDWGRRLGHLPELRCTTAGRPWTHVHDLQAHTAPIAAIAASPRGRTFATADAAGVVRLQHATSDRALATIDAAGRGGVRALAFGPKGESLVATTAGGGLHAWRLESPHPEATARTLFGRVWYEGQVEPRHVWQSSGGTDDFEPMMGLVPLLLGTLKGTLYALLFSVPIAVLAALYVSQLTAPGLRAVIKPTIELMAAMPSVVVGFLAALWLAPLLENRLGAALGAGLALPAGLLAAVGAWYALPRSLRRGAKPGVELLFVVPFLLAAAWIGVRLAGPLEAALFAGDIRQWLFDHHGITYDQRNCIVVGIALGFAVIPIVFTISEDALSAVPRSLTSGALALGASRWQTALHVILPAASPGIFAAVMLGLGRAIGETMIVLMATGNTPILDLSPFNGMRTMSAGIAVEIPEAPHGGTLYRVLFLTGFLLFCFTFLLNTGADVVGRRLRKRYGQF